MTIFNKFSVSIFSLLLWIALTTNFAFAQNTPANGGAPKSEAITPKVVEGYLLTLPAAPPDEPDSFTGTIRFIGNATVIIKYAGLTILTDPNFLHKGQQISLGYGLTSRRQTDPAIKLEGLPPIDLIVLSHLHEDHFDELVQHNLDRNIPIATTDDAAKKLRKLGFKTVYPLKKWQSLLVNKGKAVLRVTSMPGRHGPPLIASLLPQVMGSMLELRSEETTSRYRIYISGDTMVYDDLYEIPKRTPEIDLALLHLGGARILGVKVTMDEEDGVRMLDIIAPKHAIPIHYNDYDVFTSPLTDFQNAAKVAGLADKITYLKHGDTYTFSLEKR